MLHRIGLLVLLFLVAGRPVAAQPGYPPPAEVKAAFLKLLDRPRVPLDAKVHDTQKEADGLSAEKLSFAVEKKADGTMERVPALLIQNPPAAGNARRPAVLVLHGTGGTKESQRELLRELAKRGFVAIAIDGRYHGERAGGMKGSAAYQEAILRAWRTKPGERQEHPFFFDTCWDIWRTIDYLCQRDDVDAKRIGVIGFSKGGIEAWLAAAVDERIRVTVPAIAVQSFRWSLENDKWQGRARTIQTVHNAAAKDLGEPESNAKVCRAVWSKIIPGILDQFDCPSMIRLFAGRPLLVLSGELDANCPLEGAKLAIAAAEEAYRKEKCSERLKIDVAKGVGHSVTKEQRAMALAWFVKWLGE
jgi:dienelactone hydrolase